MSNETNIEQAQIASDNGALVIYTSEDGRVKLDVQFEGETVWLSQAQMAVLFDRDRTTIGKHIANVFEQGEVDEKVGSAKIAHTTQLR